MIPIEEDVYFVDWLSQKIVSKHMKALAPPFCLYTPLKLFYLLLLVVVLFIVWIPSVSKYQQVPGTIIPVVPAAGTSTIPAAGTGTVVP